MEIQYLSNIVGQHHVNMLMTAGLTEPHFGLSCVAPVDSFTQWVHAGVVILGAGELSGLLLKYRLCFYCKTARLIAEL